MSNDFSNFSEPNTMRELSFGEKAVGLTFNPSNNSEVDVIKQTCAALIDQLHLGRNETNSPEKSRMYSEAITAIQTGQMWGVKAATWKF
jgi:hypothetical protein